MVEPASLAGYSGTPLPKKLGIKEGSRVVLLGAPPGFDAWLGPLPAGVDLRTKARAKADVVLLFTASRAVLERRLPGLRDVIHPAGAVWAAWPKKASKVPTDITEDTVRDVCLPLGLVDVKVCAIDPTWSGLKLVIRTELR